MSELIELLKKINGISKKNAEKIIFDLIINKDKINFLETIIKEIKTKYTECKKCFFFKHNNICAFCDDGNRIQNKICVVSNKLDAQKILFSDYNGLIHVLNGEITLNKNIGPEKLKMKELFAKINYDTEVLLALNLTFEGEITASYIVEKIKKSTNKIFRIAKGVPLGGVIDYIDQDTLNEAITNRKKM